MKANKPPPNAAAKTTFQPNVKLFRPPYEFRTKVDKEIEFQLMECSQTKRAPDSGLCTIRHDEVPEIRLFGVTRDGHSVCVHCYNYEPYLWIEAPLIWSEQHNKGLRDYMNQQLAPATKLENTITRIEAHMRQSLLYYSGSRQRQYLKIFVQLPQHVPKVRGLTTERGMTYPELWDGTLTFPTYESNVIFPMRYMIDNDVGGCNWITLNANKYLFTRNKITTCVIEVDCSYEALTSHEPVGEYMPIAPLRILSIDIECQGRKGFFPEAEKDPVIQIANHAVAYGKEGHLSKAIFALNTCAPIAGAEVYTFATEGELLLAWMHYLQAVDPDILTGYNIINFDLPYLINRSIALNISHQFCFWSRQLHDRVQVRDKKFQSKQMGNREYKEVAIEGRIVMDVMVVVQQSYKLRSYSLNAVAQHFLQEQKEDVHHSIISDLQNGTDETRRRLAVYCLKDAYLPIRLMEKLMMVVNNVEMSRVTGVPVGWLLERGQQIKVFSMMLRKAKAKDLLFPTVDPRSGGGDNEPGVGYEGATVIEPVKGFYNKPIATLDFASLYPSIMMAHNLCYSTLVRRGEIKRYEADQLTTTPSGDTFVKREVAQGILPLILEELLTARKAAKAQMKNAQSPLEYAVLNGRQLALKISANSVYGFTGAQVGKLPCLEISASVTSYGRAMIEQTKQLVEKKYENTRVIYGDTDSVMIQCVTNEENTDKERLQTSMDFGAEAAAYVTTHFQKPIKLEFEKVYFPFLLMNKKRYAGLLWTNTESYDKLDAKGIETVRRDNCPVVATVISGVLNRVLIQRSVQSAIDFVKGTISDLLLNRLDISNLVITKAFSKSEDEYENKQAHIALVERMRARDPASAPSIGDRVAYVIIKARKGAKAFEKSEDPIFVLENNIPIDVQYYLDHHLGPPLLRVFEGVMPDPSQLIKGDHTRHISIMAPSKNAGGLMKFVKVQLQCIACRAPIQEGALCANCEEKGADVYGKLVSRRNHYEAVYSKVWTQCQRCQGSLHQDVICTSRDCPVFYFRKKAQKDLKEHQAMLDRFGIADDW